MQEGEKALGVSIVGFGKIAQDQHVDAIRTSERFFLHSVVDRNRVAAPGTYYPDIDSLLSATDKPAAIAICTPPQARFDIASKALAQGIHVLLEKPPGVTSRQVETLREMARDSSLTLYCGWHSRFAPAVDPAHEWLTTRQLQWAQINWREDARVWHPGQAWIWEAGGFGVFDPGINALSIATKILPKTLSVRAALLCVPENCAAPISAEIALADGNGLNVNASFDFLHAGPEVWEIEVQTDNGMLQLLDGGRRLLLDGKTVRLGRSQEYAGLYSRFAHLIDTQQSDVDLEPLRLVEEAFLLGQRKTVARYDH